MKILFVCMGNICRSPTAEGVMHALAHTAGLADELVLDSAGTGGWHAGEQPDPRTRAAAAKRGYRLDHAARQITTADFARFDLIVVMDRDNLANVQRLAGRAGKGALPPIELLRQYDSEDRGADVPDPYSGGSDGFEHVLDICERSCRGLLEHVRARR